MSNNKININVTNSEKVTFGDIQSTINEGSGSKEQRESENQKLNIELRKLVAQAKIETAIDKILELSTLDDGSKNLIFQLSYRYNQLKNKENAGIVSVSDLQLEQNKIAQSLLNIIDSLEK
jgi:Effector-associated domain 11